MNRALIGASACVCLSLASCQFVFEIRDYVVVEETTGGETGGGGAGGAGGQSGTGGETGTLCTPLTSRPCYSGPEGTEGVGTCMAGKETCNLGGTGWSTCFGQVVPREEKPDEIGDEGCDGYAPGDPVWWRTFGNELDQWPDAIASDKDGNVYVCGSFEGTLQFDDTSPLVSQGQTDIFLVKLNASGEAVWSKSFGNSGEQTGCLLAVDSTGWVYVAGNWTGDMFFGGEVIKGWEGVARIARFASDGQHVWSRSIGGANVVSGIAVRGNEDVVAVGAFEGTMDFGDFGSSTETSVTGADVYVLQYSVGEGSFQWGQHWTDAGSVSDGDDAAVGVAVSSNDTVAVVGLIDYGVYVGGQSEFQATMFNPFVYVQYSGSGTVDWAHLVEYESGDSFDTPLAILRGTEGGFILAAKGDGLSSGGVFLYSVAAATGGLTGYLDVATVDSVLPAGIVSYPTGHIGLGFAEETSSMLAGVSLGPAAGGGGEENAIFGKLHPAGTGEWAGTLGGQLEPNDRQWAPTLAAGLDGSALVSASYDKHATIGGKSVLTSGGRDIAVLKLAP